MKMKWPIKIIMPVFVVSLCLACVSTRTLAQNFSSIQTGMSRQNVKSIMGKPERADVGVVPQPPFFGPQEALLGVLKPGASFEEWQYTDAENIYLIWFGSINDEPQDNWRVVTKFGYPKGAVF